MTVDLTKGCIGWEQMEKENCVVNWLTTCNKETAKSVCMCYFMVSYDCARLLNDSTTITSLAHQVTQHDWTLIPYPVHQNDVYEIVNDNHVTLN